MSKTIVALSEAVLLLAVRSAQSSVARQSEIQLPIKALSSRLRLSSLSSPLRSILKNRRRPVRGR
jgi:hypothetical protein